MRKQEYIHLHALFVEVTGYLVEHEDMPAERLSEYEALDTRPTGIHARKQAQYVAVTTAADAIEPWLAEKLDDRPDLAMT